MKEATGELNATIVVIISVGILAAFFFGTLWPMLKNNFEQNANCQKAICNCSKEIRDANDGDCLCEIKKNGEVQGEPFRCVYRG